MFLTTLEPQEWGERKGLIEKGKIEGVYHLKACRLYVKGKKEIGRLSQKPEE